MFVRPFREFSLIRMHTGMHQRVDILSSWSVAGILQVDTAFALFGVSAVYMYASLFATTTRFMTWWTCVYRVLLFYGAGRYRWLVLLYRLLYRGIPAGDDKPSPAEGNPYRPG